MSEPEQRLIIIGASGLGREVANLAFGLSNSKRRPPPWELAGFLDDRPEILAGKSMRLPILGDPGDYQPRPGDVFTCAIGDPAIKLRYVDEMRSRGGEFVTLVSHRTVVPGGVSVGEGTVIGAFSLLSPDVVIAEDVCLVSRVTIGHDASVGRGSHISTGVAVGGGARLGEQVNVFPNATILPGIEIVGTRLELPYLRDHLDR